MKRTVRQLVARTPCPYRGLDDFHSFVRSQKMVRTQHGRRNASPTEIDVDRLFVRRRMIVRTRIRTPHPSACGCHLPPLGKDFGKCENVTALNEISFVGEAFRLPFCKQAERTNKMAAYRPLWDLRRCIAKPLIQTERANTPRQILVCLLFVLV